MNKELQTILESELLTKEVKDSISTAFTEMKDAVEESTRNDLEVEYAQKFVTQKTELVAQFKEFVTEALKADVIELKEDIKTYKDLDVQYAQKLEIFKEEYKEKIDESFNGFVASVVKEEVEELKEDLLEAKELQFGRELFESFKDTFAMFGASPEVKDLQAEVKNLTSSLKESNDELAKNAYDTKVDTLLEALSGSKREVMKTILEGVAFEKLESRFNETIDSVVKESVKDKDTIVEEGAIVTPASDSTANQAELKRIKTLIA